MYEIYIIQGQSRVLAERAPNLKLAVDYVNEHLKEGSWAIKYPNGNWHEWEIT
jgi:hypothetical protein